MNEKHLTLFYITNKPEVALIADKYGVDRVWIDLEVLGKELRQKNLDTVKSKHSISDIERIKTENRKHGRSDNDPALKIVIGGLTENPLEAMILLAGDDFKRNRADFIVNLVNKKRFAALKSLWSKKWD